LICRNEINIKYILVFFIIFLLSAVTAQDASSEINKVKSEKEFCDSVNQKFSNFGWKRIKCNPKRWEIYDYSAQGSPLLYQEFGFDNTDKDTPVNLVLCGVHGDERPSIYLCFYLTRYILFDNPGALKNFRVVVAPIVNPDGFMANTRQNANGIDVNRNLPTADWDEDAYNVWTKTDKDPRKYPGAKRGSEIESRMQVDLINKYKPDKIISVHAPLGFLDYDGPGDQKHYNLVRIEQRAKYLGLNIEANSKKFVKFVDYRFFPGSLGNYAGKERKIPTYTVEFPSVRSSEANNYWSALRYALIKALSFEVYDGKEVNPYFFTEMPQRAVYKEYKQADSAADNINMVKSGYEEESVNYWFD
jgi:protein MpaA